MQRTTVDLDIIYKSLEGRRRLQERWNLRQICLRRRAAGYQQNEHNLFIDSSNLFMLQSCCSQEWREIRTTCTAVVLHTNGTFSSALMLTSVGYLARRNNVGCGKIGVNEIYYYY